MLEKVGETLEENDIKLVYCKGNVLQRNKALRGFYNLQEVRVIMLSLDSAASGTNLTQATHVVLLDPFAGTREVNFF